MNCCVVVLSCAVVLFRPFPAPCAPRAVSGRDEWRGMLMWHGFPGSGGAGGRLSGGSTADIFCLGLAFIISVEPLSPRGKIKINLNVFIYICLYIYVYFLYIYIISICTCVVYIYIYIYIYLIIIKHTHTSSIIIFLLYVRHMTRDIIAHFDFVYIMLLYVII